MREPHPALAQRYAIHLPLDCGDTTLRFVGTDVSTGQTIIVAFVEPPLASLMAAGVGAMHRHLAGLVDSLPTPEAVAFPQVPEKPAGTALVAQLIRGRSLAQALRGESWGADRSVAWAIRVLEGVSALHQRHAPHGGISSHAVIAEPRGRPIAPVLSQLIAPALLDCASPERLNGSGPTIADD